MPPTTLRLRRLSTTLSFGLLPVSKISQTTSSGETTILANIWGPDIKGAYIHSISLTKNFVILCIWPAYFRNLGLSILYERSFLDGIGNTDTQTGETLVWEAARQTPGEPIFVPAPDVSKDEDDGAVLSVVLDGNSGSSYLLCLDARTTQEIGRASVGVPVGLGFHGRHLSALV